MEYKYTSSLRLYRGRVPVLESDLTKLDLRTLELAIKNKTITKHGDKKGTSKRGTSTTDGGSE